MNGYIHFVINQALRQDEAACIYCQRIDKRTMELVIEWSNGVVSQHWYFI